MTRTSEHVTPPGAGPARWWYLLLLVPFIAVLWVPFYSGGQPDFAGIPYFYWYQFLWILISAVLTAIVYFATREPEGAYDTDANGSPVEEYK
jgi:uncharacterized protein DUF3311